MSQLTRSALEALINSYIFENVNEDITATQVNTLLNDICDSSYFPGDSITGLTMSAGTYYSGSTPLSTIIQSFITGAEIYVQPGLNTYTGGTPNLPTVNISAATLTYLSAATLSAGTINSGSTNLYSIFSTIGSSGPETFVQPGLNTYTGGTAINPTVNISGGTVNNWSAGTFSAGTINSGTTNLYSIFATIGNEVTSVQPGTNIQTGGTATNPIVSTIASPEFNNLTATGSTNLNTLSATTTFIDGTFEVSSIYGALGSGGVITQNGIYTVHTFTGSGTFVSSVTPGVVYNYMIVAGGGGGGQGTGGSAGGGGAGGILTGSTVLQSNSAFTITVGAGGVGGLSGGTPGTNGGNSIFAGLTSFGGGFGGGSDTATFWYSGNSGGSGGGSNGYAPYNVYGNGAGIPGQGFSGGSNGGLLYAGGGGGYLSSGITSNGFDTINPTGGTGIDFVYNGVSALAGGGGGGSNGDSSYGPGGYGGGGSGAHGGPYNYAATCGTNGTGGGGGGNDLNARDGGSGGTGIVIISYITAQSEAFLVDASGNTNVYNNLYVSGATDLTSVNATTITSGNTNLYSIFAPISSETTPTYISNGLNTYTAGTLNSPSINVSGGTVNNWSAGTFSAGTINSGTTNLYSIFATVGNEVTSVQPGTNIQTGGTATKPIISTIASPEFTNLTVNNNTFLQGLSANTTFIDGTFLVGITNEYATGGVITTNGAYTVHTFTGSGTFTTGNYGNQTYNYMLVAGGGGGGAGPNGAGGGAGGILTGTTTLIGSSAYTITIGNGGIGGLYSGATDIAGTNGDNSIFDSLTAIGGGYGGGGTYYQANSGGSGGGAIGEVGYLIGGAGTPGQGQSGGTSSDGSGVFPAGGGGYLTPGTSTNGPGLGSGGTGIDFIYNGISALAGGGGGGCGGNPYSAPGGFGGGGHGAYSSSGYSYTCGVNGTGGGGGGNSFSNAFGGSGGTGILIISYLTNNNPDFYVDASGNTNVYNNLYVSGITELSGTSATTLSAGTINSGSTNLYSIFDPLGTGAANQTHVQPGSNIQTGGTALAPVVSTVASPSFNNITSSGTGTFNILSAVTISASTIISGSTNLYSIFAQIGAGGSTTNVQPGLNTYTGGTSSNPSVNVSAATLTYLSASTISGGTIYSGSTNLSSVFYGANLWSGVSTNNIVNATNGNKFINAGTGSLITGFKNTINDCDYSVIIGGYNNSITSIDGSVILGGSGNTTSNAFFGDSSSNFSSVLGGIDNIQQGYFASIIGGSGNTIGADSTTTPTIDGTGSVILGGMNHTIGSRYSAIIAGTGNMLSSANDYPFSGDTSGSSIIAGSNIIGYAPNTAYMQNAMVLGALTASTVLNPFSSFTSTSSLTLDASVYENYSITLTANTTLNAFANPAPGRKVLIAFIQDGTGGRTLAYNTIFRFGTYPAPVLSLPASKTDYLGFIYNGTFSSWDLISFSQGY